MLSFFLSAFQDYLVTATAQEVLKYLAPNDSKYKMTARWLLKSANFSSIRNNITREGSIHTERQNSIGRTFSQSLCCNCVQRAWNIITFLWGDPKTVTLWHLSLRIDLSTATTTTILIRDTGQARSVRRELLFLEPTSRHHHQLHLLERCSRRLNTTSPTADGSSSTGLPIWTIHGIFTWPNRRLTSKRELNHSHNYFLFRVSMLSLRLFVFALCKSFTLQPF